VAFSIFLKRKSKLLHWKNSCFSTSCDHHQEKIFAFEILFFFISFFKTLIIKNQSTSFHFDHLSIFSQFYKQCCVGI